MLWSERDGSWVTLTRDGLTLKVNVTSLETENAKTYEAQGRFFPGCDTPPPLFRMMKSLDNLQKASKSRGRKLSWSLTTLGEESKIIKAQTLSTPLVRIKLGNCGPGATPKKILVIAGVHAREWPAQEITLMLMSQLINYDTSMHAVGGHLKRDDKLGQGTIIDIIPVVNLFGFLYCMAGTDKPVQIERVRTSNKEKERDDDYHDDEVDLYSFYNTRTSKRVPSRQNRTVLPGGSDLNRNYPHNWGREPGCSHKVGDEDYCGPFAGSEPETQAIMQLIKLQRYNLTMDIHSFGDFVVMPPCYNASKTLPLNSEAFVKSLEIAKLAPPILFPHLKGKPDGTVPKILYPCAGSFVDYCIFQARTCSMTMEVGGDAGGFSSDYLPTQHSKMAMPHRLIVFLNLIYDII
jgi:hypothetical protein